MPAITPRPCAAAAITRAGWALLSMLVVWTASSAAHAQLPIDIHHPVQEGVEWRAKALVLDTAKGPAPIGAAWIRRDGAVIAWRIDARLSPAQLAAPLRLRDTGVEAPPADARFTAREAAVLLKAPTDANRAHLVVADDGAVSAVLQLVPADCGGACPIERVVWFSVAGRPLPKAVRLGDVELAPAKRFPIEPGDTRVEVR